MSDDDDVRIIEYKQPNTRGIDDPIVVEELLAGVAWQHETNESFLHITINNEIGLAFPLAMAETLAARLPLLVQRVKQRGKQ